MSRVVLVTGVTGQDGSYMVDYILENTNYDVVGVVRPLSNYNLQNIQHIKDTRFSTYLCDITDVNSVNDMICKICPDYCINFAAASYVGSSWGSSGLVWNINTTGVLNILEAIYKNNHHIKNTRFYQASSSEMFGDVVYSPQDEQHPLRPLSPYGASKCAAHHLVKTFRDSYNLWGVSGICFNHESSRRGDIFVTKKIVNHAIEYKKTGNSSLALGNVHSLRDWSHAKDIVEGIWLMLNDKNPEDYVLSSDKSYSVLDFMVAVFRYLDIDIEWIEDEDDPFNSVAVDVANGKVVCQVDRKHYKHADVTALLGCSKKARKNLRWKPRYDLDGLIEEMVEGTLDGGKP